MNKSLNTWLLEYSESHQNQFNIIVHKICVPVIFVSIYWLLFSIPFPIERTMYFNWANVLYLFALLFWFRLDIKVGILFLVLGFLLALLTTFLWSVHFHALDAPFRRLATIVFILGWIGQFIGHKIEGVKPSFLKDLQFLLIGPIWIFYPKGRLS